MLVAAIARFLADWCRPKATARRHQIYKSLILKKLFLSLVGDSALFGTEQAWRQAGFLQQAIELGAVAIGQPRRVGNIAVGEFQQLGQVIALKTLLGVGVAQYLERRHPQRALHQRQGHQRRGGLAPGLGPGDGREVGSVPIGRV